MIPSLRYQSDGKAYTRPPKIEECLKALYELPIEEVARRAAITDSEDPEYVPSECVLHFVRQSKANGDGAPYEKLFTLLRARIMRAVPGVFRKVKGMPDGVEVDKEAQVQEAVLGHIQELLCLDRHEYEDRLDFYEVRFNSAVAADRASARISVQRRESRRQPMEYEVDGNELSVEMEAALERVRNPDGKENEDFLFRLRFLQAISKLPPDERRVIEMILEGLKVKTIAMVLKCDVKTVGNRKRRACAALKAALQEEKVA